MGRRVLVTGASGFVGANLVRRLLADGHEVHLALRRNHADWRLHGFGKDVTPHLGNLDDEAEVAEVVRHARPEWIFHLAAHGAYSWQADLQEMVRTNIIGTINLVEACLRHGFDAFVYAGSSSEYGIKEQAAAETERLDPNSHYAWTKASASLFCRHAAAHHRANIVSLRLYSVYGPYEEPARLIPSMIVRGLEGRLPPLVTPQTARDFVFVDDIVDGFIKAAVTPGIAGEILNLGSGVQTTVAQVVEVARRKFGIAEMPDWSSMPNRIWDTSVWLADPARSARLLGWRALTSFEEGFERTAEWFEANPSLLDFYRGRLDSKN